MKKIFILLLLSFTIFSCDNVKDLQLEQDLTSAVPQAAINAIKKEYPEATELRFSTVERSKVWSSEFKVRVRRMNATVNYTGQILDAFQLADNTNDLPENAKKYIETNYPGATIKKVGEQMGPGQKITGYKVLIATKEGREITMVFDTTGALVILVALDSNGLEIKDGPNSIKTYSIEQKDLPEAIIKVLNEKHPNFKYIKGIVMVQNEKKTFNIIVSKDLTNFEYVFDEKGTVLRSHSVGINTGNPTGKLSDKPLEAKDIPSKIKEYLDKNYKGWEYQKGLITYQGEKIIGYLIVIKQNNKMIYLNFSGEGTFLRADNGGSIGNGQKIVLIDPANLPDMIKKVITNTHVEGFKIVSASKLTNGNKVTYYVNVVKENINYFYEFDESGKILDSKKFEMPQIPIGKAIEKALDGKDLSSKAKEYLEKNYKGWTYEKGIAVIVNEKISKYLIVIKVNNTIYYITFDSEWGFVEARKG
jgi:hypothetical protein